MISAISHQGLEKFYRTGNTAGIDNAHAKLLRFVLLALDSAYVVQDLALPNMLLEATEAADTYRLSAEFGSLTLYFAQANVQILHYE